MNVEVGRNAVRPKEKWVVVQVPSTKIRDVWRCRNIAIGREEYSIIQFFLFLLFFCQKFPFSGKLYVHCQSKLTVLLSIFCEKLFIRNFQGNLFLLSFRGHILQIQLFISRVPDDMSALNFSLCLTMKSSFPRKPLTLGAWAPVEASKS